MKKLIILAMILALMGITTVVLAAPNEHSSWVGGYGFCTAPGGADGELYFNPHSGNYHCWPAE